MWKQRGVQDGRRYACERLFAPQTKHRPGAHSHVKDRVNITTTTLNTADVTDGI